MDWLDYRQALGLSFNDNQKKSLFIKRIEVFISLLTENRWLFV